MTLKQAQQLAQLTRDIETARACLAGGLRWHIYDEQLTVLLDAHADLLEEIKIIAEDARKKRRPMP